MLLVIGVGLQLAQTNLDAKKKELDRLCDEWVVITCHEAGKNRLAHLSVNPSWLIQKDKLPRISTWGEKIPLIDFYGSLDIKILKGSFFNEIDYKDTSEDKRVFKGIYFQLADMVLFVSFNLPGGARPTNFVAKATDIDQFTVVLSRSRRGRFFLSGPGAPAKKDYGFDEDKKQENTEGGIRGDWGTVSIGKDGEPVSRGLATLIRIGEDKVQAGFVRIEAKPNEWEDLTGSYVVDSAIKPTTIDFTPSLGKEKGKKQLGTVMIIYDFMIVSLSEPGKDRPKTFHTEPKSGNKTYILQRWR
jgi:uncharacterized protein (TIGR03067 family)